MLKMIPGGSICVLLLAFGAITGCSGVQSHFPKEAANLPDTETGLVELRFQQGNVPTINSGDVRFRAIDGSRGRYARAIRVAPGKHVFEINWYANIEGRISRTGESTMKVDVKPGGRYSLTLGTGVELDRAALVRSGDLIYMIPVGMYGEEWQDGKWVRIQCFGP